MCDLGSDLQKSETISFYFFLTIYVWFHYGNPRKPILVESVCLMIKILVPLPYNAFVSVSFGISALILG